MTFFASPLGGEVKLGCTDAMNRTPLILAVALLVLAPSAAAIDSSMVQSCMRRPNGMTRAQCQCEEQGMKQALTAAERKLYLLTYEGKFREFERKANALGALSAKNLKDRIEAVQAVCRR
jgi:hypothetical protein